MSRVAYPSRRSGRRRAQCSIKLSTRGESSNPELLVQSHLRAGRLVELMPDSSVDVPLCWQHTRLKVPTLDRLTRAVTMAARAVLL